MPAFEHDGFRLFETAAITRYVDEAFAGPALQPADVAAARNDEPDHRPARIPTPIGAMVWDVYVERIDKPNEGKVSDEALISPAGKVRTCLATLAKLKAPGDWLLGNQLTLADLHAAPMFGYFVKAPEGRALLADHPELARWYERAAGLPGWRADGASFEARFTRTSG